MTSKFNHDAAFVRSHTEIIDKIEHEIEKNKSPEVMKGVRD
jgi:hypothetical protein